MPAPELVIADAPSKTYPGGIIVFKCSEWLADARGTLSTEADARSCCGTVVRDAQKVSAVNLNAGGTTTTDMWLEAEPTLEIPLAGLLEPGIRYFALLSYLIEGDWDVTTPASSLGNSNMLMSATYSVGFAVLNNSFYTGDEFSDMILESKALSQYRITGMDRDINWNDDPDDQVLTLKAYSVTDSTVEILVDQLYLVPFPPHQGISEWNSGDFNLVPGAASTFSGAYGLDPSEDPGDWYAFYVDGADGGDDNGKFTWQPQTRWQPTGFSGADGGGDFQKDDNEYMVKVHNDDDGWGDFYYLEDSTKVWPDNEPVAHCYGLHGPVNVPTQVYITEGFSDDVGDDYSAGLGVHGDPEDTFVGGWSATPEGYIFKVQTFDLDAGPVDWNSAGFGNHRHGAVTWVAGGELHMVTKNSGDGADGIWRSFTGALVPSGTPIGPGIEAENLIMSGEVRTTQLESYGGGTFHTYPSGGCGIQLITHYQPGTDSARNYPYITINFDYGEWWIEQGQRRYFDLFPPIVSATPESFISIGGPPVGWKWEIKRYVFRFKIWDASGAEPSTWNYEDNRFMGKAGMVSPTNEAYDYDDDLEITIRQGFDRIVPSISWFSGTHGDVGVVQASWSNVKVEHDQYGDDAPVWASIEQPAEGGVEVGRIEMPAGAQHLVYWGTRDWTKWITGDGSYIDFAAKVWNDAGAAELQRSEAVWWWFRSVHGGIVSMNWRSSDRQAAAYRVLIGDR